VERPRRQRPNLWLRLARGLGALLLLVAGLVGATALARLGAFAAGLPGHLLALAGSLLLNLLLFAVTFQVLTATPLAWWRLLPGAAVGAVGWTALQTLGIWVVDRQLQRANLIYGVFALVIGLLSWMYLSAQLLLYAAELNVVLARRLWPRSLLQPPLTAPDRRVLTALAETEERRPEQTIQVTFSDSEGHHHTRPPPEG
jgi:uncharacterized BrkB/YihY/UPF0761 family membrane protein